MVQKIYMVLRMLWLSALFLPQNIKLKLLHSLIVPLILYSSNVYGVLDAEPQRKLQLSVNNCGRFTTKESSITYLNLRQTYLVRLLLSLVLFSIIIILARTPEKSPNRFH